MSRTGVGCRVLIDGALLDDGCLDWAAPPEVDLVGEGVSASEGLTVNWGRSTTVDQPDSGSCSFTVLEDPGGATVLETIRLGSRVDVFADASLSGDAAIANAFTDPGFEAEVRATVRNARATRVAISETAGGHSAEVQAVNAAQTGYAVFPPGTLQPAGTNPVAWAALRTTAPGETWSIRARVNVPAGLTVRLRPVLYTGPWETAGVVQTATVAEVTAPGWSWAAVTFAPGSAATWVGFQVEVSGGLTWADVNPATDWTGAGPTLTWADYGSVRIDAVEVTAPGSSQAYSVLVFSGRITDLEGFYDDGWDRAALNVTAADFRADLGNRFIGAEPWPAETVQDRMVRVLNLARIAGEAGTVDIAPTLSGVLMALDDVDNREAGGYLTDIAQSVDGVLWTATHPVLGEYLRLEDPGQRLPLYELALVGGEITVAPVDFSGDPDAPPALSACDVLRDPGTFTRSVSDIATRVEVGWKAAVTGEDGPTTEDRRVRVTDPVREADAGTRAVSVQTLLTSQADATGVADRLLARLSSYWRIGGVAVTDADVEVPDAAAARLFILLLNGVTRGGQPLLLTDLPAWSPTGSTAPVYLEGGSYAFTGGGWACTLQVSRASGQGQNATWNDLPVDPAWKWDAWDPELTWNDLRGVAGP